MDKETKKKIQRLWHNRLLAVIVSLGLVGCSLGLSRIVLKHRPHKQQSLVLELSQSLEDYGDKNSSIEERELALDQIVNSCEKLKLLYCARKAKFFRADPYVYELQTNQATYEDIIKLELEQVLEPKLEQVLEPKLEQVLEPNLELEPGLVLEWVLERVLKWELEWELERVREPKLEWELERVLVLVKYILLKFVISKELEQNHSLRLIQGHNLVNNLNHETKRERMFLVSVTFLSLSVLLLLISLFTLTRLQSSYNLPPNSHLIAFLPEECVAEMGALARRMKKANASPWEIRLRLLEEFVTLIWVFYIQIKLENLSLPFQDNQIDE